jgi:hypothetical protein
MARSRNISTLGSLILPSTRVMARDGGVDGHGRSFTPGLQKEGPQSSGFARDSRPAREDVLFRSSVATYLVTRVPFPSVMTVESAAGPPSSLKSKESFDVHFCVKRKYLVSPSMVCWLA